MRETWLEEHDACAILASVRKTGEATHGNLKRVLDALSKMGHRSGDVNGEGDGCGVLTDIPRRLWANALEEAGKPAWLAEDRRFFVAHLMIPAAYRSRAWEVQEQALKAIAGSGAELLLERPGQTRQRALGKLAREQEPVFWQVAGVVVDSPLDQIKRRLFDLALRLEHETPIHVASLSNSCVVYKVRGSVETLYHYYPELRSPEYTSAITLGHARYSTNTTTTFERVQPFSLLGHNGEINTIAQLRQQAQMLGAQLPPGGSDSQDLDRVIATLIEHHGLTLLEAMEVMLPPILSEVEKLSADLQTVYRYHRLAMGPFAQGPAALIARHGDEAVFSVDALGLRPLWYGETEKDYFLSSEKGVFHLDSLTSDPKPLSPGEKMCLRLHRQSGVEVLDYPALQERFLKLSTRRVGAVGVMQAALKQPDVGARIAVSGFGERIERNGTLGTPEQELEKRLAAFGWSKDDREWVEALAEAGNDPISSLGYDGPLAALSSERRNVADYLKEAVAVVTNPAIDREREAEHFSTQCVIGPRPGLGDHKGSPLPWDRSERRVTLDCPILLGGEAGDHGAGDQRAGDHRGSPLLGESLYRDLAADLGSMCVDDLVGSFPVGGVARLETLTMPGEGVGKALQRLEEAATAAVRGGAQLLVLDDALAFDGGNGWLDPLLAVAAIDGALRAATLSTDFGNGLSGAAAERDRGIPAKGDGPDGNGHEAERGGVVGGQASLRRKAGIVLLSGALRNLHDVAMAIGLGADAVAPYLLLAVAVDDPGLLKTATDRAVRLSNAAGGLRAGLEKVISTMGIHELRGYGRVFSAIGLSSDVAECLGVANYAGSERRGLTWADLDEDVAGRAAIMAGAASVQLARPYHIYPKVWKIAGQVARGEVDGAAYEARVEALSQEHPVALRNVMGFRARDGVVDEVRADQVEVGLTGHDLPFVIASMSFGSQGETAFRAYAEAAYRLNMIALNGEGGEIPDMLGKYPHNRGQQIASGRFGVDVNLLNSSNLLEIKVGQGAKPGEGGHLPGRKVSAKVASARHARRGVDLISPSNNHDIYSIEDLAQFIEELKTANPKARVAVKVPVVPGIGIIAVGIAKAGADIINLTGYEGGTGAARKHSLRHVGLPAEIGLSRAHGELVRSGLRQRVELWCDGGMRTASDVVKMICLGANRVGFGTLAMVAIGCTICRACQTDTCHVGIATQIESADQAHAHGLKRFEPRDFEPAVQGLVGFFGTLGEGVREITAGLGFRNAQELVGRADLLEQTSSFERLDLAEILRPARRGGEEKPADVTVVLAGQRALRRPRNHLTTVISNLVMEAALTGEEVISFEDDKVTPVDRALGTHLAGALTRYRQRWMWAPGHGGVGGDLESWRLPAGGGNGDGHHVREANLRLYASSVPGNGLGAYTTHPISITVEGGAQDGVAKGMHGGRVVILKGYNHNGQPVDGSVGKSLAYGAIGGLVIVQGDADSRACIRLSGADVIIGGHLRGPLDDRLGFIGARANVKGFLCEYMTAGRVLVLGDPGPWMCAGMTGGVLYLRLQPSMGFDRAAIGRRLARGAKVELRDVGVGDEANLHDLIGAFADELLRSHQQTEADRVLDLLADWRRTFVKIEPLGQTVDQTINTE